ncbi:MAG: response regulator [Candidatus Cloacimonetes bacterium]|nr:response regulator [Candidatus Cloacimonadota bacterium]
MASDAELIEILIVDDDQGDIELTREVLAASRLKLNITDVHDGEECLRYLRNEGKYRETSKPDLIFLDLNMPRMDGREALKHIKADPDLRHIPVVILTTSDADEDIIRTYSEGANCYVQKPVGLSELQKVVSMVESFWFSVVKLPTAK